MKNKNIIRIVLRTGLLLLIPLMFCSTSSVEHVLLFFTGALTPARALAQSYRYSSEGRSALTEEELEEIGSYRGVSSGIRTKINRLDDDPVKNLPIPILFGISPANLYPNFGDPRDGGARTHEGEDIMAPKEAPIVSPTKAVVVRTGTGGSSGKYVYTANPGGETFVYMHLNEIAVKTGESLNVGSLIGYVGNTGNASGGLAHLHFEIRKRVALDPYPRLTKEFDLDDKISFITDIIDDENDDEDFITFLAETYQKEFLEAKKQDIDLPREIEEALKNVTVKAVATVASSLDLTVGSSGTAVVTLQNFLIVKDTGEAAQLLALAGATGYFGPITKNALAEYQLRVGISPAAGYYGSITRAYIMKNQ